MTLRVLSLNIWNHSGDWNARRAGLRPPFNCQAGNCGTCLAFLETGEVTMRENNVLDADEVAEGWVLTCQAVCISRNVRIEYPD